jgi:hypothetical protein
MKLNHLLVPLFLSQTALAAENDTCKNYLSSIGDSRVFRVKNENTELGVNAARQITLKAIKSRCQKEDIAFSLIECKEISERNFTSNVCYLESAYGYFFVMADLLGTATVVWNRWD